MLSVIEALGGRKAIVFFAVFVFSCAATFFKVPVADNIIELLQWIGAAYMASNGIVAISNAVGAKKSAPESSK